MTLTKGSVIYLAAPYTSPDPLVQNDRFERVSMVAAELMRAGYVVYSPLAQGVAAVQHLPSRCVHSHEFWMAQCLPMLERCDVFMILPLEGWENSKGLGREREFAMRLQKPSVIYTSDSTPLPARLQPYFFPAYGIYQGTL